MKKKMQWCLTSMKGTFPCGISKILKFFGKINISYSFIHTRSCAYQWVRSASFSEICVVTFGLDIIWFSWFNDESSVLNLLSRRDNSQSLRCSSSIQVAIALREWLVALMLSFQTPTTDASVTHDTNNHWEWVFCLKLVSAIF